jgi:hypothetical protein
LSFSGSSLDDSSDCSSDDSSSSESTPSQIQESLRTITKRNLPRAPIIETPMYTSSILESVESLESK